MSEAAMTQMQKSPKQKANWLEVKRLQSETIV
jgi:hypothetical protein